MFCLLHQKYTFRGYRRFQLFSVLITCEQPPRHFLRHITRIFYLAAAAYFDTDCKMFLYSFHSSRNSTSIDGIVRLWDARTSQCVREQQGHTKAILDFALSRITRACSPPPTMALRASSTFNKNSTVIKTTPMTASRTTATATSLSRPSFDEPQRLQRRQHLSLSL